MSASAITLDEDAIDDILYLARVNETGELDALLSELSTRTKRARADVIAAAVDPYSKNTALHYAAANGHSAVINALLSNSQDKVAASAPAIINATNDAGNTPLHWAALNGHVDCVKLLTQLGADVTIINAAGHDAVFEAEINDKKDVVDWLLGAVEALEKGVGHSGDTSGSSQDTDEAEEAGASVVEEARVQMEGLNTDQASRGG